MSHVDLARRAVEDASYVRFNVIKRIAPQNVSDESFIRMFLDEARINAELHHANIAQVYDFGKYLDSGTGQTEFFLVMEYVPGVDLRVVQRAAAAQGRGIPLRYSLTVLIEVLRGLQYAHTRVDTLGRTMHIVHRDVNPRNVMLSVQGDVKVIDFGVAMAADRLEHTQGQNLKGKFAYMAPEQIEGNVTLDGRADVFAVGLMLYELVMGQGPFQRLTELQIMHRILTGQIPQMLVPAEFPRPEMLHHIQQRALAIDRDARYRDADAMRVDLEQAVALVGGPCSEQERAAFLDEIEPERVRAICQRLQRYHETTFPGMDSHTDTSTGPVESTITTLSEGATLAGVPAPEPRRTRVVPILFLVVGLAVGTIAMVMLRGPADTGDEAVPGQSPRLADVLGPGNDKGSDGTTDGGRGAVHAQPAVEEPGAAVSGGGAFEPSGGRSAGTGGVGSAGSAAPQVGAVDAPVKPEIRDPSPADEPTPVLAPASGSVEDGPSQPLVGEGSEGTPPADAGTAVAPVTEGGTEPVAETPVALANGYLQVASEPRGLEVYVDGTYVGRTPLRGYRLPEGSHAVTIKQSPGKEYSTQVEIKALQVGSVTHKFSEEGDDDDPKIRR